VPSFSHATANNNGRTMLQQKGDDLARSKLAMNRELPHQHGILRQLSLGLKQADQII
jgi:hypothetical protein